MTEGWSRPSATSGDACGTYTCLYKPLEVDKLIRIIKDVSRRKRNALMGEPF